MGFKGQGAIDKLGSNPKPVANPQTAFKELHSKANRDRVVMMPVNDKKSYIYWDLEKITKKRIKHINKIGRIGGILEIHSESGTYPIPVEFNIRKFKSMEFYATELDSGKLCYAILKMPQLNISLRSNTITVPKRGESNYINDVFATPEDLEEMLEFMSMIGYSRATMLKDLPFMLDMLKASQEREAKEQVRAATA